jgi:hypothetical protein
LLGDCTRKEFGAALLLNKVNDAARWLWRGNPSSSAERRPDEQCHRPGQQSQPNDGIPDPKQHRMWRLLKRGQKPERAKRRG